MRNAAAAILLIGVTLAGCGGSDGDDSAGDGAASLDEPIQLADCTDWNEGSVEERLGTIRQIRAFISTPVPGTGGGGVTLDDERAYELFEGACSRGFARSFTLYRLYVRAAAFSPESRSQPPQD
jgi:hypothetical protein